MTARLISPVEVDAVWPHIAHIVQPAVDRQNHDYTAGEFHALVRTGRGFLFVREQVDAVAIVAPGRIKGVPVAFVELIAAVPNADKDWRRDLLETVRSVAASHGAKKLIGEGRKNFQKIFPEARIMAVRYELEIG